MNIEEYISLRIKYRIFIKYKNNNDIYRSSVDIVVKFGHLVVTQSTSY